MLTLVFITIIESLDRAFLHYLVLISTIGSEKEVEIYHMFTNDSKGITTA